MTSATTIGAISSFVETSEHRRFADFCDACSRYRYIGLCCDAPRPADGWPSGKAERSEPGLSLAVD